MRADVIVVGLGTMGAAAAWQLARRGVRVIGLDRFQPPHARGAHGGGSRIIRMAYMEGADYVPLVRRAYQLWHELEEASGQSLLTTTGGLMLGSPDSVVVTGARDAAIAHGLAFEMLDAATIRRRFPGFTPAEHEVAVYEGVAGLLRPEASVKVLLQLARDAGAQLLTGVTVRDWRADDSAVSVDIDGETVHGDRLVLAVGAWSTALTELAVPLNVQRRVQHYWAPQPPEPYQPGSLPVWIWQDAPGEFGYGLPAVDGRAKAALHHGNEPADPDVGAAPARRGEVDAMRSWLAGRLPGLAEGRYVGSAPCLYTLTPDEHFVLGLHPSSDRVAVACGFSGHGFKFAPVVGEILADLATTAATDHPIGLFDPTRFTPSRPDRA